MRRTLTLYSPTMPGVVLCRHDEPDGATIMDALNNVRASMHEYGPLGSDWELRRGKDGVLRVLYGPSLPEQRQREFLVQWE